MSREREPAGNPRDRDAAAGGAPVAGGLEAVFSENPPPPSTLSLFLMSLAPQQGKHPGFRVRGFCRGRWEGATGPLSSLFSSLFKGISNASGLGGGGEEVVHRGDAFLGSHAWSRKTRNRERLTATCMYPAVKGRPLDEEQFMLSK